MPVVYFQGLAKIPLWDYRLLNPCFCCQISSRTFVGMQRNVAKHPTPKVVFNVKWTVYIFTCYFGFKIYSPICSALEFAFYKYMRFICSCLKMSVLCFNMVSKYNNFVYEHSVVVSEELCLDIEEEESLVLRLPIRTVDCNSVRYLLPRNWNSFV